ncbi:hypothetical protein SLE2022_226120 [Rubroshorea leprosula]
MVGRRRRRRRKQFSLPKTIRFVSFPLLLQSLAPVASERLLASSESFVSVASDKSPKSLLTPFPFPKIIRFVSFPLLLQSLAPVASELLLASSESFVPVASDKSPKSLLTPLPFLQKPLQLLKLLRQY